MTCIFFHFQQRMYVRSGWPWWWATRKFKRIFFRKITFLAVLEHIRKLIWPVLHTFFVYYLKLNVIRQYILAKKLI
jgi:hypothetical protein